MPHRSVKVTRPRRFHLANSKLHQPITNLSGDGEAVDRIDFDKDKIHALKAKLAAVGDEPLTTDASPADQATAEADRQRRLALWGQRKPMTTDELMQRADELQRARSPGATEDQIQKSEAAWGNDPEAIRQAYAKDTNNPAWGNAPRGLTPAHLDTTAIPSNGNLGYQIATDAAAAALPTGAGKLWNGWGLKGLAQTLGTAAKGFSRSGVESSAGNAGQAAATAGTDTMDSSLTAEQLANRDQLLRGSKGDIKSQLDNALAGWKNGIPGAEQRYMGLMDSDALPNSVSNVPDSTDRVQAYLDPATRQELTNGAGTLLRTGATSMIGPWGMPAMAALPQLYKTWHTDRHAPTEQKLIDTGRIAEQGLGTAALATKLSKNAPTVAPAATKWGRFGQKMLSPLRTLSAPSGVSTAAQPLADAGEVEGLASKAGNLARLGGRFAGRLGALGAVYNAGNASYNAYKNTFTDKGQEDYANAVRAQTEADAGRSGWQRAGDIAKATGSLATGDPDHMSHIIAEGGAGQGYRDSVAADSKAADIQAKEYGNHYKALEQYFPGATHEQLNEMAQHAATNSVNNYRMWNIGKAPYNVGVSSFEKRLNDPNGPFAQLPPQQMAIYKDLGRRLGGRIAEGLVGDPNSGLNVNAKVPTYTTPYVTVPGDPQPAAPPAQPALPPGMPHGAAQRNMAPVSPIAPHGHTAPQIKVPPPVPPNPGMAPLGQPFSPLRGAKTAVAKLAAMAQTPMGTAAQSIPAATAPPVIPAPKPAMPAAAPPPAIPKPYKPPSNILTTFGPQPQHALALAPVQLEPEPTPAPTSPPEAAPAPVAQPGMYDWQKPYETLQSDYIKSYMPWTNGEQARAAAGANFTKAWQEGMTSDAALSPEQKQQQMATREKLFGSPVARMAVAAHFNDPSMADPHLPFAQFEQKMGDNGAKGLATTIQAQLDKVPSQTPGELLKNNWQLAMIPLGIMMAMSSSGSMGKIMGVLMALGGGVNVYGRYSALKDPAFTKYVQAKAAGTTTPETDAKFANTYGDFAQLVHQGVVNVSDMVKQDADKLVRNAQPDAVNQAAPVAAPAPQAVQ